MDPIFHFLNPIKIEPRETTDLKEATIEYRSNLAGVKKGLHTSKIKIIKIKVEKLTSDTQKEKKFQEIKQFTIKEETHVVKRKRKTNFR